jgi:glycosyltransferase involved in cell wall biosynthesis
MNHKSSESILMISHNNSRGGASRAAFRLHLCLLENNSQVEFLVAKKYGSDRTIKEINFFRKILCYVFSRMDRLICRIIEPENLQWKTAAYFGAITARTINKSSLTVVNLHWIGHGLISLRQLNKIKKPTIWTLHDEWIINSFSHYTDTSISKYSRIRNFFRSQRLVKKIDFIMKDNVSLICVNLELLQILRKKFPLKADKIFYVPNPVDLSVFYPDKTFSNLEISAHNETTPFVLFLGGVSDRRKGWDLLKEALKINNGSFTLGVIGDFSEHKYGNISVVPIKHINNNEILRAYYSKAHLVLVPSRAEQLPQVATESLSCGTPVVAFKVGGLSDIVFDGQNGLLVKPFNVKEFSDAISYIINKPKSEFIQNCRNFAEENFSFNIVSKKYNHIINNF